MSKISFLATLKKADTSMQPSVYDKFGAKTDIFQYADARAATIRAEVEPQLKAIDTQLKKGLTVDDRNYADIGASIKGETNRSVDIANSYTDAALVNYKAFTIKLVDELPLTGAPMTFYPVPPDFGTR